MLARRMLGRFKFSPRKSYQTFCFDDDLNRRFNKDIGYESFEHHDLDRFYKNDESKELIVSFRDLTNAMREREMSIPIFDCRTTDYVIESMKYYGFTNPRMFKEENILFAMQTLSAIDLYGFHSWSYFCAKMEKNIANECFYKTNKEGYALFITMMRCSKHKRMVTDLSKLLTNDDADRVQVYLMLHRYNLMISVNYPEKYESLLQKVTHGYIF